MVTDGRASGNRSSFADAADHVTRAGVRVFVVALNAGETGAKGDKRVPPDPTARLRELGETSGGGFQAVERKGVSRAVERATAATAR